MNKSKSSNSTSSSFIGGWNFSNKSRSSTANHSLSKPKSKFIAKNKSNKNSCSSRNKFSSNVTSRLASRASSYASLVPSTAMSNINDFQTKDKVICSICHDTNYVKCIVGISFLNLTTGEIISYEYTDSQLYVRTLYSLKLWEPLEIYISDKGASTDKSKFYKLLCNSLEEQDVTGFGSTTVIFISNKLYNLEAGQFIIQNHLLTSTNNKDALIDKTTKDFENKYLALKSMAAVFLYYHESYKTTGPRFNKVRIKLEATEKTALIDIKTIKKLELIENLVVKSDISLFKFMDHTITKMGKRMLKNSILQPLTNVASITMRLNCVTFLNDQTAGISDADLNIVHLIRKQLHNCKDLDYLFIKLLVGDIGSPEDKHSVSSIKPDEVINFLIALKTSLESFKEIGQLLLCVDDNDQEIIILNEIKKNLNSPVIDEILENIIKSCLNEDVHWATSNIELQNQRIYAIRSGSDGFLDVSRTLYQNIIDEVVKEIESLSTEFNLCIEQSFDDKRGFFLKLLKTDYKRYKHEMETTTLPNIFINVNIKSGKYVEFSTLKIMKLNSRFFEIISEISILSEKIGLECISKIKEYTVYLFMFSESLAMLDFICSLTQHIKIHKDYTVPNFDSSIMNDSELRIKSGRHPLLEKKLTNKYIANDTSMIKNVSNVQLVTGCNGSGKSIYLKQTMILSIMAQIGSYVPCNYGKFPIFHRFYSRFCSDIIELNTSTFELELREINFFLQHLESEPQLTMLAIDEFGRGSSIGDGFAICLATVKYFLNKNCFSILATHFNTMPMFLQMSKNFKHINMVSHISTHEGKELGSNVIKMSYKAKEEPKNFKMEHYGLKIASGIFDKCIITKGFEISKQIKEISILDEHSHDDENRTLKKYLKLQILRVTYAKLQEHKQMCKANNIPEDNEYLKSLQNEFIEKYSKI
ncbi:uncharacterized protein HGUI_00977 [Hanseniaspora guilliermondii]|uniref:DNA mismatch repair proteins mutS family domain-containing protein n=1 Tax=Hanseniaspora guilliermondii TaxID=56406 RepID=A0A1L0CK86_9ASCO|nr:uncharacterized protein HGUI_00977 [Hanseniaspora guilliermondii]